MIITMPEGVDIGKVFKVESLMVFFSANIHEPEYKHIILTREIASYSMWLVYF